VEQTTHTTGKNGYRVTLAELTWRTVDVLATSPEEAEALALDNPDWGRPGPYPQFEANGCEECHDPDFRPANAPRPGAMDHGRPAPTSVEPPAVHHPRHLPPPPC